MLQNNWKEIAFADQKTLTIHGKEESLHAINFGQKYYRTCWRERGEAGLWKEWSI